MKKQQTTNKTRTEQNSAQKKIRIEQQYEQNSELDQNIIDQQHEDAYLLVAMGIHASDL